jgi:hypothetical protein
VSIDYSLKEIASRHPALRRSQESKIGQMHEREGVVACDPNDRRVALSRYNVFVTEAIHERGSRQVRWNG